MSEEYENIYRRLAKGAKKLIDTADRIAESIGGGYGIYDTQMLAISLIAVLNRNRIEYTDKNIKEVKVIEDLLFEKIIYQSNIDFDSQEFKEKLMEEWDILHTEIKKEDLDLEYYTKGEKSARSCKVSFDSMKEVRFYAYKLLTEYEEHPWRYCIDSFCAGFIAVCREEGRLKLSGETKSLLEKDIEKNKDQIQKFVDMLSREEVCRKKYSLADEDRVCQ
jgi:hypothetical protein